MYAKEILVFSSENREKIINNRINLLTKLIACVKMTNVSVSLLVVSLVVISNPSSEKSVVTHEKALCCKSFHAGEAQGQCS